MRLPCEIFVARTNDAMLRDAKVDGTEAIVVETKAQFGEKSVLFSAFSRCFFSRRDGSGVMYAILARAAGNALRDSPRLEPNSNSARVGPTQFNLTQSNSASFRGRGTAGRPGLEELFLAVD